MFRNIACCFCYRFSACVLYGLMHVCQSRLQSTPSRMSMTALSPPFIHIITMTSHGLHTVSNHQQHDCVFNTFRLTPEKHQSSAWLVLSGGNPLVAGRFPSQRASSAKVYPCDDVIIVYKTPTCLCPCLSFLLWSLLGTGCLILFHR